MKNQGNRDVHSRIVGWSALIISIVFGCLNLYYAHLRVHHKFRASIYGYEYALWDSTFSVDIVLQNDGNQYETFLGARIQLPVDSTMRGEAWPGGTHIRLSPFVLKPGERIYRRLSQGLFPTRIAEWNTHMLNPKDARKQPVLLEIMALNDEGYPIITRKLLCSIKFKGAVETMIEYDSNSPKGKSGVPFISADLLTGQPIDQLALIKWQEMIRTGDLDE